MPATATIRDLRNHFPRVRRMLDAEGEVLVTERGKPAYRLIRYAAAMKAAPPQKDYLARMRRHQGRPMSARTSAALHRANRGDR